MIHEKSFLQSFDSTQTKKKNFEAEIACIKAEQKALYAEKLEAVEKRIYDEVHAKISKEFDEKLKSEQGVLIKKYAQDIKSLTDEFHNTHEQYIGNFTKVIQFFINHHIVILNKSIMKQEIVNKIKNAFQFSHQQKFQIYVNSYTLKDVKATIDEIPYHVDIHIDDELSDGTLQATFDGGGIYFSVVEIMNTLSEICSDLAGIDFSEF